MAIVLVVAISAVIGIGSGGRAPGAPGAGMTPAAFVESATQTTLSHRTADVVFTGSVSAAGTTVPLRGSGQADLTAGDFVANVTIDHAGRSLLERELVVNGHFYMDVTEDGADISSVVSGKHWVDIPVPSVGTSGSLGTGTVDPINQLQLLTKHGNVVRPLGTSVIEGVTVSGYAITPSRQSIEQGIRAEIATGELSPAAQQQLQQATKTFSGFTLDVWFDGSGLMHRMSVDIRASGPPSTDAHVVMTFQDYGTPVNVAPPPSEQVISYSAFLAALQLEQTPPT